MRRLIVLSVVIMLLGQMAIAQKAKYHSDIIYKISNHISWATYNSEYKFVIGIVGNSLDFNYFQSFASKHHLFKNHPIEVRYFACTDKIDECDLIYISEDCTVEIDKIVRKTRNEPILIVSGKDGYGSSGSVINFLDVQGKIKFELNQEQARQRGLKVSDDLKKIAILI